MNTVNHSVLQPPNLHPAFNLIYRSEADREAGTNEVNGITLSVSNIGQLAKQLDNNSYWELLTVTPSITWAQISGGTRQPTTADQTIYIATTGDDTTGDGSLSAPYATFDRAFRDVQDKDIEHVIKIKPAAGTYTSFPRYMDLKYSPGGRLIIDASGETYPVKSGPFTVSTVTGVGQPDLFAYYLANDLQVSGSPGWTVDEHYGYFAKMLTGNWAGFIIPIWKNTADTIRTYFDWKGFQIGDTFEIVSCPVIVDIDHEISLKGDTPGEDLLGAYNPQLLIAGLQFEIDTGDKTIIPFFINALACTFTSCAIKDVWDTDAQSIPLALRDSSMNFSSIPSGSFDNSALEDFFTATFMIYSMNGAAPTANGWDLAIYGNSLLESVATVQSRRSIWVQGDGGGLWWVMSGGYDNQTFTTYKSATAGLTTIDHLYIEQIGFTDTAIKGSAHTIVAELIMIEACDLPVSLLEGANMVVGWLKGTTIGNAYAVELKRSSQMHITSATHVTILGSSGAVKFTLDGTTHAAWPTSGNFHSKANSYVVTE